MSIVIIRGNKTVLTVSFGNDVVYRTCSWHVSSDFDLILYVRTFDRM